MPGTVVFALIIESALIVLTVLLLIRPKFLFRQKADKLKPLIKWSGVVFLLLTFCWSVLVGVVLSMNEMTFRI